MEQYSKEYWKCAARINTSVLIKGMVSMGYEVRSFLSNPDTRFTHLYEKPCVVKVAGQQNESITYEEKKVYSSSRDKVPYHPEGFTYVGTRNTPEYLYEFLNPKE